MWYRALSRYHTVNGGGHGSSGSRPVPRQDVRVEVNTRGGIDTAFVDITREAFVDVVAANANAAGPVRLRITAADCTPGRTLVQDDGDLGLVSPTASDASLEQTPSSSAQDDLPARAGHAGSQLSRDAVGVLLEIANSRTASARTSTAAPA